MALSDVAANLTETDAVPHKTCQVCHYTSDLTADELATFEGLLRNKSLRYSDIHKAFRDDPDLPTFDYSSLRRHGNGEGGHEVAYR